MPVTQERIVPDSLVQTGCFPSYYVQDAYDFRHYRINRSHLFTDRGNQTNSIENL